MRPSAGHQHRLPVVPGAYYPNMQADTPPLGSDMLDLLSAIQEGLITREEGGGPVRNYVYDGQLIGYNTVRHLARLCLIDVSLAYPPVLNAYGARVLREYIEAGGYGESSP